MLQESDINSRHHYIYRIRQLYKSGSQNGFKSKLFSDKFSKELASIPELITFIDAENKKKAKTVINELGSLMQVNEYKNGFMFNQIFSNNENNNLNMILKGTIVELGIKYIKKHLSFKEYILYLTKIYLLNEKYLYLDCIKRNYDYFPFNDFLYYINKDNNKEDNNNDNYNNNDSIEEEKNSPIYNLNDLKDIDIIKIGKSMSLNILNFNEEMKKIEEEINNSKWKKYIKKIKIFKNDYNKAINSFLELYNYDNINIKNNNNINNNKNSHLLKEVKYNLYIPYFYKKKIIPPISFIGDFNFPFQMKNYSTFITLENSFIISIDKSHLSNTRFLFKYSHDKKLNYISENIFTKHYIFKYINLDYLKNYGKYFDIIKLKKDEIVFSKGEPNKGVYLINKGCIQIIANQSYLSLINLNFFLLHSIDFCSQYISDIKKEEITSKNILSGYYHYNKEKNILMKNPIFAKNSKLKEDIIFGEYIEGDLLGLGEMINYRNNLNLFTAKVLSDNIELIFIPREIFQALLSNDDINKKCGFLIEKKTRALKSSIQKYKNFFENKINNLINKDNNNNINNNHKSIAKRCKSRYILRNTNLLIKNYEDDSNKFKMIKKNFINNNNSFGEINNFKKKKKIDFFSMKEKLASMKLFKNNSFVNKHFNKTFLIKDKSESILNCESVKKCFNKKIFKNKNISINKANFNKSTSDIKLLKDINNKRFLFNKFNKITPNSFLGRNINNEIELEK